MFGGAFGGGGKKKDDTPGNLAMELSKPPPDDKGKGGGSGGKGGANSGSSVHGFDPSALERAAKAAKELDSSRNSKDALVLINTQEVTKQKEAEMERSKFLAMKEELAIRRVQEEEQSAKRTLDNQTQHVKVCLFIIII